MGERGVRNAEVEGSNPLPSTIKFLAELQLRFRELPRIAAFCHEPPSESAAVLALVFDRADSRAAAEGAPARNRPAAQGPTTSSNRTPATREPLRGQCLGGAQHTNAHTHLAFVTAKESLCGGTHPGTGPLRKSICKARDPRPGTSHFRHFPLARSRETCAC